MHIDTPVLSEDPYEKENEQIDRIDDDCKACDREVCLPDREALILLQVIVKRCADVLKEDEGLR